MEWSFYSLDKKPNYEDLSKNEEIATGIKINPKINMNYSINGKIYNVAIIDITSHYVGVHTADFIDIKDIDETLESEFTCPYCRYVDYNFSKLEKTGETNCPRCNSKLEYLKIITIDCYSVTLKEIGGIIYL